MALGKKVAIFDWEWGRNLAPGERQKKHTLIKYFTKMYVLLLLYEL